MEQAVAAGRESIDVGFLTQALEDRSMGRVEFALEPASTRMLEEFAGVEQALLGIIMAVGRSANSETSIRSLDLGVNLTRTNPEAAHWAKTRSSALVVEISESTRAAIRRIMHLAFIRQIPPRETARLLVDLVGLTEAQAEAVWAFRQELLDSPGRLVRRARTTVRVPARGISAELLAKRVREYSERLLRHRTLNIARTETIAASNEGQRQVWLQAVENELVSPEVQREWIAAPGERTCPICKALDGQVVGLEERFVLPDGSKVMGPPAHTACRCGQGLTPASLRAAGGEK